MELTIFLANLNKFFLKGNNNSKKEADLDIKSSSNNNVDKINQDSFETKDLNDWTYYKGTNPEEIKSKAWEIYWNNEDIQTIINRFCQFVVGNGLKAQSNPSKYILGLDNEKINNLSEKLDSMFSLFNSDIKISSNRKDNFKTLQMNVFKKLLIHGEVFIYIKYKYLDSLNNLPFELSIIPNSSISGGDNSSAKKSGRHLIDGIEYLKTGEEFGYWINTKNTKKQTIFVPKYIKDTDKQQIIHLFLDNDDRYKRGLPLISSLYTSLSKVETLQKYALEKKRLQNKMVANVVDNSELNKKQTALKQQINAGADISPNVENLKKEANDKQLNNFLINLTKQLENIDQVNLINADNYKLSFVESSEKSEEQILMFNYFLQSITRSLGMPLSVFNMRFDGSFSTSLGEIRAWELTLKVYNEFFSTKFCNIIYDLWVQSMIDYKRYDFLNDLDLDNAEKIVAIKRVIFYNANRVELNPLHEAKAADIRIANGVSTRTQEAKNYNGRDFDENITRLEFENKKLAEANKPFEKVK